MSSLLFRLGRFSYRRWWAVIPAWIIVLAIAIGAVGALNPQFSKDFELPGTDAGIAMDQMAEYFPAVSEEQTKSITTQVVIKADDGLANHTEQIDALVADLQTLPEMSDESRAQIINPVTAPEEMRDQVLSAKPGAEGRIGLIGVKQDIEMTAATPENKAALVEILDQHRGDGLTVEAASGVMSTMEEGGTAELIGFAVAFVVMIVAFAALIAAFIPLITAAVGVMLTILLLRLSTEFMSVNESAIAIVTMLGIAVSIDYALFIVSRYRNEVNRGGDRADAAGRAVGTAGTAVVFAGLTVVIAVAALMVIGVPFITQMGLGAALAVILAVLTALTLIPAILGLFKSFVFKPKIPFIKHASETPVEDTATEFDGAPDGQPARDAVPTDDTNGVRFGRMIVKRPIPFIIAGLAILVVAAIPASKLELGMDMASDDEVSAQELIAEGFGAGVTGPLFVVVSATGDGPVNEAADATVDKISAFGDVSVVNPWMGNGDTGTADEPTPLAQDGASAAMIVVTPDSAASSPETHELMEHIRGLTPQIEAMGAEIHVGGETAIMSDLSHKLDKALIPYLVVVVGLAFIIMVMVFRSLWVPLIGTLGFVFSVLATFGVTVLFFQEGALGLIDHTKPILSFLPIFLIGVVFGLAMDYQVFLVTRMREEYVHGMNAKDAIVAGYRHGARVVTSAAIIMISVFAAFMLAPDTTAKMMGFALAIAVFFDAFIIRMTVVPAVIALLGDRAWSLPKWLDKIVPNLDVEGGAVRNNGLLADYAEDVELDQPVTV